MDLTEPQRQRLRDLREGADLRRSKLARVLGVSHTHIASVEDGRTGISMDLARRWAMACGGTLEDILGGAHRQQLAEELLALGERDFDAIFIAMRVVPHLSGVHLDTVVSMLELLGEKAGVDVGPRPRSLELGQDG